MATAIEGISRYTTASNTAPAQRWLQAMTAYKAGDVTVSNALVNALFRQTGIPIGSAYGQYAIALMASVSPEIFLNGAQVNALSRQVEQKPPVGSPAWQAQINPLIV